MLFQIMQAHFLRKLQDKLSDEGLTVIVREGCESFAPAWADDVAILAPLCGPDELIPNMARMVLHAAFCSRDIGRNLSMMLERRRLSVCSAVLAAAMLRGSFCVRVPSQAVDRGHVAYNGNCL